MNGLYVIGLVLIGGIWYTIKIIQHSKLRNAEKNNTNIPSDRPYNYKWLSLVVCLAATSILVKDVISTVKLTGAGLAQSGFGMFFDFVVYVIPSILIVIICLYRHLKRIIVKPINVIHIITDPFVILSVLVVLLPIIVFVFS